MRDFTFYNPTRIEFGKDKEAHIGQYLKEFGVDSALILYGSERVKRNGLFDRVATSLEEQGITFAELGGVISNPLISRVRDAFKIAKEKGLQAVLAVGGDSVLDLAKAVAAGIDKLTEWFSAIGAPVTFAEAGLSEDAVDPIAENAFGNAKLWRMDTLYPQERIANILKLAV